MSRRLEFALCWRSSMTGDASSKLFACILKCLPRHIDANLTTGEIGAWQLATPRGAHFCAWIGPDRTRRSLGPKHETRISGSETLSDLARHGSLRSVRPWHWGKFGGACCIDFFVKLYGPPPVFRNGLPASISGERLELLRRLLCCCDCTVTL